MKQRDYGVLVLVLMLFTGLSMNLVAQESDVKITRTASAIERSPAEAFGDKTVVYLEVQPPSQLVNFLLDHPLRTRVESIPQVKQGLKSKQFAAFLTGIGLAQVFTGMDWQDSLDTLAGKGMAFAFEPENTRLGAVWISSRPEKLEPLCRQLLKFANQNDEIEVNEGDYRGKKAFAVGKDLFLVLEKDRVFLSNKKPMVKEMVDRWLDQSKSSLASKESFQKSKSASAGSTLWTWVDLKEVRSSGFIKEIFVEKTENIGAELIIGGLLEATRNSNFLSGSLNLKDDELQVSIQADLKESAIPPQRTYFFGSPQERSQFERIDLENKLVELVAFRDLGKLWLSKEELFDENHLAELSQADSTLSTLFSGLDFGEEVLGSTLPGVQLVARNQDYQKLETPVPDIKIPEFALVFRLKPENEKVKRRFRVAYQSFVGFLNIQLAMQGQPQLELESEKMGAIRVVSATYLPEEGKEYEGLINYNFSPTIAFADQWFIVSSTRQIATDLAKAGLDKKAKVNPSINTGITVYGPEAREILQQNSEQLIAQNMLEEGNDRDEAKAQIDLILNLVGLVQKTALTLENENGQLSLNLGLKLELN